MVRLLQAVLVLLALCSALAAKPKPFIEINLETSDAFFGDTVVIEVRWSGLLDPIDLSALTRDADLVRETAGTRIAVIEGQVVDILSRRIELLPRRTGLLTLGPLAVDGLTSNSVSIDITEPTSVDWQPGPDDLRLEQTLSEPNPWLQQQTVLDIVFRTRHPILEEVVTLPQFDNFRAVPIYTQRRTLDESDSGWSKVAWRYLLFPQRSGELTIAGASIAGTAAKSRAERGRFEVKAPPIAVAVKPSVFGRNSWWVAASALTLSDEWSSDPTKLSAGDEVERVVRVAATGVLPEQLPDIVMGETRGLTVTPLEVTREDSIIGDVAQAKAAFRFRIRAMSPVPVFLDTIRVRWWDTVRARAADAIVPARRIDIGIPDRGVLVDNAMAGQSWWDRMLVAAARLDHFAYAALACALIALLWLLASMPWRIRQRRSLRRIGHDLGVMAGRGDASALHERLRSVILNDASLRASLAPTLRALEVGLFGGGHQPDLKKIATEVRAALRSGEARHTSALPPL